MSCYLFSIINLRNETTELFIQFGFSVQSRDYQQNDRRVSVMSRNHLACFKRHIKCLHIQIVIGVSLFRRLWIIGQSRPTREDPGLPGKAPVFSGHFSRVLPAATAPAPDDLPGVGSKCTWWGREADPHPANDLNSEPSSKHF